MSYLPKPQVHRSHYAFNSYMTKKRWASTWYQLREVLSHDPNDVLEIGPGLGILTSALSKFGVSVTTLDIDPELTPDVIATATDIPLPAESVDVTCAFQILEHMPFGDSLKSMSEMCRVSRKAVIISLPDAKTCWPTTITIPKIGPFHIMIPRPFFRPEEHVFNGQHFWEINKKDYPLNKVSKHFSIAAHSFNMRTFVAHENPYHRFFVFTRNYP